MKSILILVVLGGFLFLLNYINPKFDDHKSAISAELKFDSPIWNNLEYKDFLVASSTTNTSKGSMVSFGLCKFVKVVDMEWVNKQKSQ